MNLVTGKLRMLNFLKNVNARKWTLHVLWRGFSSDVQAVKLAFDLYEPTQIAGSNAALIVMHGLLGTKQNWRSICRSLAQQLNMKIYAVDARNHGDSPHTNEHTSVHMAADLVEFARQHNIEKLNVLGHSMGGRTMMYLALKFPDLVKSSIFVDISPIDIPRDLVGMNQIFETMKKMDMVNSNSLGEARAAMKEKLLKALNGKYESTVNFIMMNLRKRPSGEFYWAVNVDALHENMSHFGSFRQTISEFAPYQGPTLFICGRLSKFCKQEEWPEIKKMYPNAEIEWLDTGHLVHLEKPVEFTQIALSFLQKNSS